MIRKLQITVDSTAMMRDKLTLTITVDEDGPAAIKQ